MINTSSYGNTSEMVNSGYFVKTSGAINRNEMVLKPKFGDLLSGESAGVEFNSPIPDCTYAALGTESPLCHFNFVNASNHQVAKEFNLNKMDFAFAIGQNLQHKVQQKFFNCKNEDNNGYFRWCPNAREFLKSNVNSYINLLSNIPVKKAILLPIISCWKDSNPTTYWYFTYEQFKAKRSEGYTNIAGVYFALLPYSSGITTSAIDTDNGIVMLNPMELPPFNYGDHTISEIYNYATFFKPSKRYQTSLRSAEEALTPMFPIIAAYYDNSTTLGNLIPSTSDNTKFYFVSPLMKHKTINGYEQYYYDYSDIDSFETDLKKWLACFGLFFTLSDSKAFNYTENGLLQKGIYLGILENGIGHGKYSEGEDNAEQEQWKKWNNGTSDSTYDPSKPSGDEGFIDLIPYDAFVAGGQYWINPQPQMFGALMDKINSLTYQDEYIQTEDGKTVKKTFWRETGIGDTGYDFFGRNPIDCLVKASIIFCDTATLCNKSTIGDSGPVQIGSWNSGSVLFQKLTALAPCDYNYESVEIPRYFNDFRDYTDTTLTLYVPFCGTISLPASLFVGRTCSLRTRIHPLTGDIFTAIYCNSNYYASLTGNCSSELAINGNEASTYSLMRLNLKQNMAQSTTDAIQSVLGGIQSGTIAASMANPVGAGVAMVNGLVGAVGSAVQHDMQARQYHHLQPPVAKITNGAPSVEYSAIANPYILVVRCSEPELQDSDYMNLIGHTNGRVMSLGSEELSGFICCDNAILDGLDITEEEKAMLLNALKEGIII